MDKFEEKEVKKIRPFKNTWSDCLNNYVLVPIRKIVGDFEDSYQSFFKKYT